MIRVALALIVLAAGVSSSAAENYTYTIDGFIHELHTDAWPEEEGWPAVNQRPFTSPAPMGETLDTVRAQLGGTIVLASDDETMDSYLCYRNGGVRTLIMQRYGVIEWVVMQPDDPATAENHQCTEQPAGRLQVPAGTPSLGATAAELAAWSGVRTDQIAPRASFAFIEELSPGTRDYTVRYRLTNGVVDAISLEYSEFE